MSSTFPRQHERGGDVRCSILFHKAILLFVVLSIAASPALAAKVDLSGQVTYRERIALPAGATLGIELVDQTLPNAPPRVAVASSSRRAS